MVCVPPPKLDVVNEALVTPPEVFTGPWPILVEPSKKETVPVGVPEALATIVAVKVTDWPNVEGFADEVIVVVVFVFWKMSVVKRKAPLSPAGALKFT